MGQFHNFFILYVIYIIIVHVNYYCKQLILMQH